MANDGFVTAVPPNGGEKRRVPLHYLKEPFNFKLPREEEPAGKAVTVVKEPARPETKKEAQP